MLSAEPLSKRGSSQKGRLRLPRKCFKPIGALPFGAPLFGKAEVDAFTFLFGLSLFLEKRLTG